MSANAFELRGVTKTFGATTALADVSIAVPRRSIVGLLGRNGSGKTTLLHHVTGLVLPTSGSCITLGADACTLGAEELSRIGVVNQRDTLLGWMRVHQLLSYVSTFYRTWDQALQAELVRTLDIDVDARVGALSPGNAQKVGLVVATCHHPELLLLDEPLSDLDPFARREVLGMLLGRFRSDDITIVISSHMIQDIERVIDRVILLEQGRVVADAELDALKEAHGKNLEQIFLELVGREKDVTLAHSGAGEPAGRA
ncbi:MAG: ABC transporter ATP-binding protein [Gemmatimonadaceae bacterium]|nr:ABC transporter ATP-binding protein [Gemmatimonadaceae bacterium]